MKHITLIFGVILLLTSCDFLEIKEKKAIETCKKAKVQIGGLDNIWNLLGLQLSGLTAEATWLDFANIIAKKDPNTKLEWSAKKTEEEGLYLVSFADERGWGYRWEVNVDQQIVIHVNGNEYLSRKYGLSRLDRDGKFKITDIATNTLKIEKGSFSAFSYDDKKKVVYIMKGSVVNNTGKNLTEAKITGELQVIFKDKTLKSSEAMEWAYFASKSGFKKRISKSNPWKPNEKLDFDIKTKGIDEIYVQYDPEYVFFNVNISAEDPIGFKYDKVIEEYDLKDKWKNLRKSDRVQYRNDNDKSQRLLTENDLIGLSKEELRIMRNEIYARHGYIFKSQDLRDYFSSKSWYSPQYNDISSKLSTVEKKNVEFIRGHE